MADETSQPQLTAFKIIIYRNMVTEVETEVAATSLPDAQAAIGQAEIDAIPAGAWKPHITEYRVGGWPAGWDAVETTG